MTYQASISPQPRRQHQFFVSKAAKKQKMKKKGLRITPGNQPNTVNKILMMKFESHPVLRRTAAGGRKRARK